MKSILAALLTQATISHKTDTSSGSIGRRYSRSDEIAIPFAITIDFDSLKQPYTVTLRERDTFKQVRAKVIFFKQKSISSLFENVFFFLYRLMKSRVFFKVFQVVQ
jgi:glycyl-tRNA synthetase (class II)